jgi:FG-GAP repeat
MAMATCKPSDQHFRYANRHALAVGDFNGDGYADIFAGSFTEDYSVWLNQGNGTFQAGNGVETALTVLRDHFREYTPKDGLFPGDTRLPLTCWKMG